MSTSSHPQTCRCSLHASLEARRHDCYRDLAFAILGPSAPIEDRALANALAEHARLLKLGNTRTNITALRPRHQKAA